MSLVLTPGRGPLAGAEVRVDIVVVKGKPAPWFFSDAQISGLNVGAYHRNIFPHSICEETWRACLAKYGDDVAGAVLEFLEVPDEACSCCVCASFEDRERGRWEAFWDFMSEQDTSGFDSFDFSEVDQRAAGRSFTG